MVYVIPALHSVQYLYFVWLMKRNEARAEEGPPAFGRPVAVRLGLLALSALALGWRAVPRRAGVARRRVRARVERRETRSARRPTLPSLFAFVNIHHYFMDHVIWRRENPDTRHLRG